MRDVHRVRERVELSLDNRQVVAFVICSLVVLGMVFALGVLVGKQLAASAQGQARPLDPLGALDAKEQGRLDPEAAAAAAAADPDAGVPLTFANELTKPKAANPALEPMKPKGEKAEAKKPEAKKADAKAEPAAMAKKPEPTEGEGEARSNLSKAFDKGSGKAETFCLQVSSLPDRESAEKLVAKLATKGYTASVAEADIPGKGLHYRVRVGSYTSRADADSAAKAFKKKAGMAAIVTNK